MSDTRNNELLRANQSYSTNGFSISCLLPWVHSNEGVFFFFVLSGQNRCQPEKVNEIKGFGGSRANLSVDKIEPCFI